MSVKREWERLTATKLYNQIYCSAAAALAFASCAFIATTKSATVFDASAKCCSRFLSPLSKYWRVKSSTFLMRIPKWALFSAFQALDVRVGEVRRGQQRGCRRRELRQRAPPAGARQRRREACREEQNAAGAISPENEHSPAHSPDLCGDPNTRLPGECHIRSPPCSDLSQFNLISTQTSPGECWGECW